MSVLSAGAPSATLECVEEALVAVSSLHETLQKMYIPEKTYARGVFSLINETFSHVAVFPLLC